ncbi:MAG TPA: hypothetical protein VHB02_16860 [Acidimicrobiales bacterium]|nr:hypothetical protein [Acidimicrobiales bacterium]
MTPAAAAFPAADAAFYVVFGLFAVAFVALVVITLGWAVRQDRSGRQRWLQRQQDRTEAAARPEQADPTDGGRPVAGRRGRNRRRPG